MQKLLNNVIDLGPMYATDRRETSDRRQVALPLLLTIVILYFNYFQEMCFVFCILPVIAKVIEKVFELLFKNVICIL